MRRRSRPPTSFAICERLRAEGLAGRYGYYEAIDYTPGAAAGERGRRRGAADVHGAPPGHEPDRARQPPERAAHAGSVSRRSAHSGGRAAAAGADPAARAAQEPADRNRGSRPVVTTWLDAGGPPLRDAEHAQPARASAVERLVLPDGHQRRRRLQPAAASRADAMAPGHHERRLGQLLLRARHRQEAWSGPRRIIRPAARRTTTR